MVRARRDEAAHLIEDGVERVHLGDLHLGAVGEDHVLVKLRGRERDPRGDPRVRAPSRHVPGHGTRQAAANAGTRHAPGRRPSARSPKAPQNRSSQASRGRLGPGTARAERMLALVGPFAGNVLHGPSRVGAHTLPLRSDFSKMPRTGGQVPTVTVAPACAPRVRRNQRMSIKRPTAPLSAVEGVDRSQRCIILQPCCCSQPAMASLPLYGGHGPVSGCALPPRGPCRWPIRSRWSHQHRQRKQPCPSGPCQASQATPRAQQTHGCATGGSWSQRKQRPRRGSSRA